MGQSRPRSGCVDQVTSVQNPGWKMIYSSSGDWTSPWELGPPIAATWRSLFGLALRSTSHQDMRCMRRRRGCGSSAGKTRAACPGKQYRGGTLAMSEA